VQKSSLFIKKWSTSIIWVWTHMMRHTLIISIFLFCIAANAALAAVAPILIGMALNAAQAVPPHLIFIAWAALWIFLSQVGRAIAQFGRVYSSAVLGERVERDVREEVYASLLNKDMNFHTGLLSGEAMAQAINDVHELNLMIKMGVGVVAVSISFLLTPIFLAPQYSPLLILEPLLFFAGYILIATRYLQALHATANQARLTLGAMNQRLAETLNGIEMVKGTAQEAQEITFFNAHVAGYRDATAAQGRVEARFFALLLLGVVQGLGFAHALFLSNAGKITTGDLVGYMGLLFLLGYPAFTSLSAYSRIARGLAAARRVFAVMQAGGEQDEVTHGCRTNVEGTIRFEHVSFGYTTGQNVLCDVHFEVEPTQTVALVGETGSGKTTLVKLLNRTYDVGAGHIFIDDVDIQEWNLTALRRQIAVIEQDIFLFSRTIAENIAFGAVDVTREIIEEAAKLAQAHEFIIRFKDGYETLVGVRGVTLSGGQRQRIALARALLTRPRILILDDATSAVDSATEDLIQQAVMQISASRTTILITNRLWQIRSANKILILHQGCVEAYGTHEELLRSSPSYRRLFEQDEIINDGSDLLNE
jgi:ATP-binding cassette subfamily B protein